MGGITQYGICCLIVGELSGSELIQEIYTKKK